MTTPASMDAVIAFWAAHLGCRRDQLTQPGTSVVCNGPALVDYRGATVLYRPPACVVAVPADWRARATAALARRPAAAVFDPGVLEEVFGAAAWRVIGPAWLGYADASDFLPAPTLGTRLLTAQDLPALRQLAAAAGPTAWAHSGIDPQRPPVFGCYAGSTLAAAGTLRPWGERLLHLGILTHPAHRGRGLGTAVVSAMTTHGLAAGAVVQYRTLASNVASMAIAKALGFGRFGQTLAVRLTPAS